MKNMLDKQYIWVMFLCMYYNTLLEHVMSRSLSTQTATHDFRQSLKHSSYEVEVPKMSWPLVLSGRFFFFFATRTLIKYFLFINQTNKFRQICLSSNVVGLIKLQIVSASLNVPCLIVCDIK
jgi:hypothetical protein